ECKPAEARAQSVLHRARRTARLWTGQGRIASLQREQTPSKPKNNDVVWEDAAMRTSLCRRRAWCRWAALAVLLLPLLTAVPGSAQPVTFKVGISEPVNTVLAIWMADAAGFYEAHGIKVEIINMQ